jgi:anaerobic sulfite reductase subunit C
MEEVLAQQSILDINTKEYVRSGYRILKERGKSGARLRVPAGNLPAEVMPLIQQVAEKYGNGFVHLTTRQGIEILHIDLKDVPKIKEELAPVVKRMGEGVEAVVFEEGKKGYNGVGTRNIVSCVGNRVCPFANCDSSALAERIEREFFEKDFHMKIGISACPNDCARARAMDIGIIGVVEPLHDPYRCVGCSRCVNTCNGFCGAMELVNQKALRDEEECIFCGECIKVCPTHSWKRGKESYHMVVGGRMGKRDPRLAMPLIEFIEKDTVIEIIRRTYEFIDRHIDRNLKKEFVGYIVDRVGFERFKREVLSGLGS